MFWQNRSFIYLSPIFDKLFTETVLDDSGKLPEDSRKLLESPGSFQNLLGPSFQLPDPTPYLLAYRGPGQCPGPEPSKGAVTEGGDIGVVGDGNHPEHVAQDRGREGWLDQIWQEEEPDHVEENEEGKVGIAMDIKRVHPCS